MKFDPDLIRACIEVERLVHGGDPSEELPSNIDEYTALYPDGAIASCTDFTFPEFTFAEGEKLAIQVLNDKKLANILFQ